MNICFATNNQHKLQEVRFALQPDFHVLGLEEINCKDELPETGNTLEANALEKAEYVFTRFGIPCFADDSGLEVYSLDNAPGVYSARYAGSHRNGEDNINLLLKNLATKTNRKAQFRTVICWVDKSQPRYFEGIVKGEIIKERRGIHGFGYDPVFIPEGHDRTFAEMTLEEKNALSHRSQAVKKLIQYLASKSPT
jgi:XTP/dITP diphosphohydrolase